MDEKTKFELLQSVRETASILGEARNSAAIDEARTRGQVVGHEGRGLVAEGGEDQASRRVALALDPCLLFAGVLVKDAADGDAVARGLRLCAAKIRAGDTAFIYESLTGQVVMLQHIAAAALKLLGKHDSASVRAVTVGTALKAQALAAKILTSLLALEGAR